VKRAVASAGPSWVPVVTALPASVDTRRVDSATARSIVPPSANSRRSASPGSSTTLLRAFTRHTPPPAPSRPLTSGPVLLNAQPGLPTSVRSRQLERAAAAKGGASTSAVGEGVLVGEREALGAGLALGEGEARAQAPAAASGSVVTRR
jgi:hypothetical protein